MKSTIGVLLIFFSILILANCKKEKAGPPFLSDTNIYSLTRNVNERNYYKNGQLISPLGNSPHPSFTLWLNNKAASVLDLSDELPIGAVFPDSSLIVKQIGGSALTQLAVMYKLNETWYWGEYAPNGDVVVGIGKGGSDCINCHSQSGNRDYTVTYTLH